MSCVGFVRRYWRGLLVRWIVLAAVMVAVAVVTRQDLRTLWPVILLVSGLLNIALTWVA